MHEKTWHCSMCGRDVESIPDPCPQLEATPQRVASLLTGLPRQQLALRSKEGDWSIQEVLSHLADAEVVWGFRYRKLLAEETPDIAVYNQELFAANLAPLQRPARELLAAFRAARKANVLLLGAVPRQRWARTGMHPRLGPFRVQQLAEHVVHHDENHVRQIEAIRASVPGALRR
ncbi:MAG: DinB family protein [Chloroflexi bacterium]|nr:DinB family protein [Chloroflexota bacterium]